MSRFCNTCIYHNPQVHDGVYGGRVLSPLPWGICLQRVPAVLVQLVDEQSWLGDLTVETRADETCANWAPGRSVVRRR